MKLTSEQLLQLLNNSTGGVTFNRCGLDIEKNFLHPLNDSPMTKEEAFDYCVKMIAGCPYNKCAIFIVKLDGLCSANIKFNWDDFDYFELPEDWHYWNFSSFVDEFDLPAYGLIKEIEDGKWQVVTE